MEGRVHKRHNSTAAAIDPQLRHRRLQALLRSLPGKGRLSDVGFDHRRSNEPDRVLVRGNAVLPRGGRADRAVSIRRPVRGLRGAVRGGQVGARVGTGGLVGEGIYEHEERGAGDARLHRGVVGRVERGARVLVWDGGAFVAPGEEGGGGEVVLGVLV
ncbi:hypothetical protein SASPL_153158 [Salvia splendens]|uniref:Uncharacterized protein n=1 Tax=Salvia splendens TaxID=180675 RepID=A0A8X8Z1X6_SALSN|nr:hypothetical protein SASPL_153158 [Salvia splendens]